MDLSIVIPTHNSGEYLRQAIDSVLSQSVPCREILVVDDGSTDDTAGIVSSYAPGQIVYKKQSQQGPGLARNAGAALATGKYLAFLDSDDLLAPGMVAELDRIFIEDPVLDAVLYSARPFGDTRMADRHRGYYRRKATHSISGKAFLRESLAGGTMIVSPCLYAFKRSVLTEPETLLFNEFLHEDQVFTPELLSRCRSVMTTEAELYLRRYRHNSIMTIPSSEKNVVGYLVASNWWASYPEIVRIPGSGAYAGRLFGFAAQRAVEAGIAEADFSRLAARHCEASSPQAESAYEGARRKVRPLTLPERLKKLLPSRARVP